LYKKSYGTDANCFSYCIFVGIFLFLMMFVAQLHVILLGSLG